ncbi:MAG: electron transport complex subunit RsxG [Granulosicoccus sp.]
MRTAITLCVAFLLAIAVLSGIYALTRGTIQASEKALRLESLQAVLPASAYDNDPLESSRRHIALELGSENPLEIYTVYNGMQPVATALEIVAPDGYNGDIKLLLGISYAGAITGARVLAHRETPGLGDDIDIQRSDWITGFDGQSLENLAPENWEVKQRGGSFDAFTGATITPQAVVRAIYRALLWFQSHRAEVFRL